MTEIPSAPPLILISNDDGVEAPGLKALAEAMGRVGEVVVCAPRREQSAKSHGITVFKDLVLREHPQDNGAVYWSLDGAPADCVKFALGHLLEHRKPALVVSGINRGANSGVNILYSGTVAAAAEAALFGLPALAVSLAWREERWSWNFSAAAQYTERVARQILQRDLPWGVVLNMNVPAVAPGEIAGMVVTRMSRSMFYDKFVQVNAEGADRSFQNMGDTMRIDFDFEDNDEVALNQNKVSITPLEVDRTHYEYKEILSSWLQNEESG